MCLATWAHLILYLLLMPNLVPSFPSKKLNLYSNFKFAAKLNEEHAKFPYNPQWKLLTFSLLPKPGISRTLCLGSHNTMTFHLLGSLSSSPLCVSWIDSSLLMTECYFIVWMDHSLLIHSPIKGHWLFYNQKTILKKATMNTQCMYISFLSLWWPVLVDSIVRVCLLVL